MGYAFNQLQERQTQNGTQEDDFSAVCSEESCAGYLWIEIEPRMIGGAPRPVWHGVDVIEDWLNVAPPIGKDLTGRLSSSLLGHYVGTETGHNVYPHVRRYQYVQYVDDRANGVFSTRPVPGTDIRHGEIFWKQVPGDTTQLTRTRWKTCVSEGCFHWSR